MLLPNICSNATFKNLLVDENILLVTITVADKNDNKPYFKHVFYKAGKIIKYVI
jgi:hypothetical protein